jgi:uncharacterized protein YjaG (DUF416 family)
MKIEFQELDFIIEFEKISFSRQILFSTSICERLLPFYISVDFDDSFNHQTFSLLRDILDYSW